MSAWPQVLVIAWLVASVAGAVWAALLRPVRGRLIFTDKQQRIAAAMFGAAALSEASLLWAGGFFERMF